MFRDIMLIVSLLGVIIFGFFIMKRLDAFLEQNRKAVEEKNRKCEPHYIIFDADASEEDIIKEIDEFRKKHKNTKIVVYDSDDTYAPEFMENQR